MNTVKYPRTPHLPWSKGMTKDDKMIESLTRLMANEVVVTEKLDGENTTLYSFGIHARSENSLNESHPSRNLLKVLHASIAHDIPEGMRICGENVFAKHSIHYTELTAYFQVFSIWQDDVCYSWTATQDWCDLLGLTPVPHLYRGEWNGAAIMDCYTGESAQGGAQEGYVVRKASSFLQGDFSAYVAKYVRANHVSADRHWRHAPLVPNILKQEG